MKAKEPIKVRLSKKTVKELKAICFRLYGQDFLRGNKKQMVNQLCATFDYIKEIKSKTIHIY